MGNQAHRPPRRLILAKHGLPVVDPAAPPSTWPLSVNGHRAAQALAAKLDRFDPTAIVSSVELKAVQSAKAMSEVLGLACSIDEGLCEQRNDTGGFQDQGVFEALVARMFAHPHQLVLGEETGEAARHRFGEALDRQLAAHLHGDLIVVAHGRVITLWASVILGVEPMALWKSLGLANALVLDGEGGGEIIA